jgi:uncharacterized membrane protein (Fun14 family)
MNNTGTTMQGVGLLETMKEKLNFNQVIEKVQESRGTLIDVGLYGCIGFLTGFLIKRYSTIVILMVLMVTGLLVLQQFELISVVIHWSKVNELLGLPQTTMIINENMPMIIWEWARANMIIVVSAIVGFLVGVKLG